MADTPKTSHMVEHDGWCTQHECWHPDAPDYARKPAPAAVTTREEWRVTGSPGQGFPLYDFTFGNPTRLAMGEDGDPEAAARAFMAPILQRGTWVDGPHLSMRSITETDWVEITEGEQHDETRCAECDDLIRPIREEDGMNLDEGNGWVHSTGGLYCDNGYVDQVSGEWHDPTWARPAVAAGGDQHG